MSLILNSLVEFATELENDLTSLTSKLNKSNTDIITHLTKLKGYGVSSFSIEEYQQILLTLFSDLYILSKTLISDSSKTHVILITDRFATILAKIFQTSVQISFARVLQHLSELENHALHIESMIRTAEQQTKNNGGFLTMIFYSKKTREENNLNQKKLEQLQKDLSHTKLLVKFFKTEIDAQTAITLSDLREKILTDFPKVSSYQRELSDYKKAIDFLFSDAAPAEKTTLQALPNMQVEIANSTLKIPERPVPPSELPQWAQLYLQHCDNQLKLSTENRKIVIECIGAYESECLSHSKHFTSDHQSEIMPPFICANTSEHLLNEIDYLCQNNATI